MISFLFNLCNYFTILESYHNGNDFINRRACMNVNVIGHDVALRCDKTGAKFNFLQDDPAFL